MTIAGDLENGDYIEDQEQQTQDYLDVTSIMKEYKGRNNLIIDGIFLTVDDYRKIATEWQGNRVTLVEIEPSIRDANELAKWKGNRINLSLCGHEEYDLTAFMKSMSNWEGKTLSITHSGPTIFSKDFIEQFSAYPPKYKELYFRNCTLSHKMLNEIGRRCNLVIRIKGVKYTDA